MRFISFIAFFAAAAVAMPVADPEPLPEAEPAVVEPKACRL